MPVYPGAFPRPGTRTSAPPCATSNPAAKPSPRSPASSAHPAASTQSLPSLHPLHQCSSAATSLIYGQCYEDPAEARTCRAGRHPVRCVRDRRGVREERGRRAAGSAALAAPPSRQERGRPGSRPAPRQRCGPRRKPGHSPRECPGRRRSVRRHPGWAAPADHDPLADIGGCEADLEPVAHAGHLFPGRAARRRVPGPGPGAWIVAGLGAAAGSGGRLRVGDGGMMPF